MKRSICLLLSVLTFVSIFLFAPVASAKDELKNTDPDKYYIVLDLKNQTVTVYERDENGEYTRIVRRFICSTGKTVNAPSDDPDAAVESTPTPTGVWKIGGRERFGKFAKFSEYARYWTQLVADNYFHSVMFKKRDVSTMMKNPYRNLGNDVSHGCIRLLVEDAKWLYYYACPGTTVRVTNSNRSSKSIQKALSSARNMYDFKDYSELQANFYDHEELENDKAWVTHENAAIRKESKGGAKKVQHLEIGDELEVLLYNDAWVKVRSAEGREGYVYRGYITMTEGQNDTSSSAYVMKGTTWMCDNQSIDSEHRICKVPFDTPVKVLEIDEGSGYAKIEYFTEIGYVKTKALRTTWGLNLQDTPPEIISAPAEGA